MPLASLRARFYAATVTDTEDQYPFRAFLTDLVHEVAYRARCELDGCGVDDNWNVFAADYQLTESDYRDVRHAMADCGWTPDLQTW
jgi:hypothetical protein